MRKNSPEVFISSSFLLNADCQSKTLPPMVYSSVDSNSSSTSSSSIISSLSSENSVSSVTSISESKFSVVSELSSSLYSNEVAS